MKHLFSFSKLYLIIIIGFVCICTGCKKNNVSTNISTTSQGQYLTEMDYYSLYSKAQSKGTFAYDANCLQISQLLTNLDTIAGTFDNSTLTNYTYNSNGTHATDINQKWDKVSDTWINTGRATFHYQNGDTSYSSVTGESWINNTWQLESLDSNTYDNNHHLIKILLEIYNDTTSTWIATTEIDYTYNSSGQKIQAIETPLQTSTTMIYEKVVYIYDANGNLTTQTDQASFNSPDNWINGDQIEYSRNANKQIVQAISQYWNPLNNTWADNEKVVYNYSNSCH